MKRKVEEILHEWDGPGCSQRGVVSNPGGGEAVLAVWEEHMGTSFMFIL